MISVIIPTYNRERTILRSIDSVLRQTYDDIEVIVVDDCSTDRTGEVISGIGDSRVRYYRLEVNQGACTARNKGIELARGDHIAFQDSDDIWLPQKLEKQLAALMDNSADVCFCKLEKHCIDDSRLPYMFPEVKGSRFFSHRDMYLSSKASTQTILAKKRVCDDIRFDSKVRKAQDYDWTIRASEKYSFFYLDEPLAVQYLQDDSISVSGVKGSIEAREYFLRKYQYKFSSDPDFETALLRSLARNKTILINKYRIDALRELKRAYEISHSLRDRLKYCLAKMRIYGIYVEWSDREIMG